MGIQGRYDKTGGDKMKCNSRKEVEEGKPRNEDEAKKNTSKNRYCVKHDNQYKE